MKIPKVWRLYLLVGPSSLSRSANAETWTSCSCFLGRIGPYWVGTSGDVVGRYERGDISPSIEVVSKIADALEVSVDYLIGKTRMELDKDTMRRIEDISALPQENKNFVLNLIDMALRDFKTKKAYAK